MTCACAATAAADAVAHATSMRYTRFTFFHALYLIGIVLGLRYGAQFGHHHFGTVGTIACAMIGMVLGIAIARLPESMAERSLFKSVERGTDAELQAIVDRAGRYVEPGSW